MPSRVYVIELERAAGKRRDPRIPWVYVGSSARAPEKRFQQHLDGYKSAGLVKRFALRLRPDLFEDLKAFPGSKTACRAEHKRAKELADCGFVAHSDGTSYGKGVADFTEWDEERLEPVAAHVDAAAAELAECTFQPLSNDRCARLLHGELGFWVRDFLDQDDPPPAYGMFSHVEQDVLRKRVDSLASEPEIPLSQA